MAKPKNPSYRELKRAAEEHPCDWSYTRFNGGRYLIRDSKMNAVCAVDDVRTARRIVAAINAKEGK